ncbi:MAG: thiJ/pfpI-family protein [Hahellaceae bacterium]|nr:thiJ/pfpI-family protein [Hahellaceae bacterium]MCP5169756.1 thiJ/pfpI-family protein [Hahellaceae bacterium]
MNPEQPIDMDRTNKPVVMVLPAYGFDPSEAAIAWKVLMAQGISVVFATPEGAPAQADEIMVTGQGLDWWAGVPGLKRIVLVGRLMRANAEARRALQAMLRAPAFQHPIRYEDIRVESLGGMIFPGGHDKRIRPLLENDVLREKLREAMADADIHKQLPVAAVCHGVLVVARTLDSRGHSLLKDRSVTALPWDFERKAWWVSRIFRFWDPHYYRTYQEQPGEACGYMSVEAEVKRALKSPNQFRLPEKHTPDVWQKTSGMHRDSSSNERPAWVVKDGNLVTARWPGDVHVFARTFADVVKAFQA